MAMTLLQKSQSWMKTSQEPFALKRPSSQSQTLLMKSKLEYAELMELMAKSAAQ